MATAAGSQGGAALALPLRVALVWNGALQAEDLLVSARPVKLGPSPEALFPLPVDVGGESDVTVLLPDGASFSVQPLPGMGGFVYVDGQQRPADTLRGPQRIGPNDYGVLTLGSVALFFQHVRSVQGIPLVRPERDASLLACLGLSLFLQVGALLFLFLVAVREYAPVDTRDLNPELVKRFMVVPPPEEPARAPSKAALEADAQGKRDRDERGGKRHERAEGRVGKRDATRENTQIAGEPKDAVASKVRGLGLLGVLSGGASASLNSALNAPSLDKMLGGMGAMQTVVGRGSGGLGLRGTGVGGGGDGQGTLFGAGAIGTGIGSGGGRGRGAGRNGLPGAKAKEAQLALDDAGAKVHGFLSKEQIDRVVRSNQAAIKYCFESEIQHKADLSGAVHMNWRIDLQGRVTTVRVAKSTLGNARVEGCMVRQIKRWVFPKPDGGEVEVTYPFLLRGS